MMNPFDDDGGEYCVLQNGEGQYSLWPLRLSVPAGWERTGPSGGHALCLAWIDANWTDMRPKSLVAAMAADRA